MSLKMKKKKKKCSTGASFVAERKRWNIYMTISHWIQFVLSSFKSSANSKATNFERRRPYSRGARYVGTNAKQLITSVIKSIETVAICVQNRSANIKEQTTHFGRVVSECRRTNMILVVPSKRFRTNQSMTHDARRNDFSYFVDAVRPNGTTSMPYPG